MKAFNIFRIALLTSVVSISLANCVVIRPGEVGFKTTLGRLHPRVLSQGSHGLNPFISKVIRFDTRAQEFSDNLHLPTKEGLEIIAEVTFMHHLMADSALYIYKHFGLDRYESLVRNTYIATAREITAHYYAKDLITQREDLEKAIHEKLASSLSKHGIVIDVVLVRDIELPEGILAAINNKVKSEQASLQAQFDIEKQRKELDFSIEAQRKQADFSIEKQKKEAERTVIEAEANAKKTVIEAEAMKKAQTIIDSSLSEKQLRLKSLEVTKTLAGSNNTKVIITDGKNPMILNGLGKENP